MATPAVDWVHSLPRGGRSNEFPSTFDPSSPEFEDYLWGIGNVAGAYVIVGVVLGLLSALLYCLACCRCCCFDRCSKEQPGCCRRVSWAIVILAGGAACVVAFASSAPAARMAAAVGSAGDGIGALADATTAVGTATQSFETSALGLQYTALRLAASLESKPAAPAPIDTTQVEAVASAAASAASAASQNSAILTAASDALRPTGKTLREDGGSAGSAPIGEAAALGALLLLFLVTLLPMRICKCVHCVMSPCMSVCMALVWVVCGVLMAVALVSSDLCVDMRGNLVRLAKAGPADLQAAVPSVEFYLRCEASPGLSTNGTFYGIAVEGRKQLNSSSSDVASLDQLKMDPRVNSTDDAMIDLLQANFDTLLVDAINVEKSLSCSAISEPIGKVIDPTCRQFISEGFLPFWAMQVTAAVLLSILLLFNLMFCIRHPSQVDEIADSGLRVQDPVGSRQGVVVKPRGQP